MMFAKMCSVNPNRVVTTVEGESMDVNCALAPWL